MGQWADTAAARPTNAWAIGSGAGHVFRDARRRTGAFTLIELLVIIGVIALLLSLMAPAATRILLLARISACKSNLHQMGNATAQYAADNGTYVPRDAFPNGVTQPAHYQFAACLSRYINGKEYNIAPDGGQSWSFVYDFLNGEQVFLCPAVDQHIRDGDPYVLNYVVNALDYPWFIVKGSYSGDGSAASKLSDLPRSPSEIMYIVEFNPGLMGVRDFTIYDVFRPYQMPFDKLVPQGSPRMIHAEDMRHDGETTIVHFDGHATTYKLDPYEIPVSLWNPDDTSYDPPPR